LQFGGKAFVICNILFLLIAPQLLQYNNSGTFRAESMDPERTEEHAERIFMSADFVAASRGASPEPTQLLIPAVPFASQSNGRRF
jgi:hypothetical protein